MDIREMLEKCKPFAPVVSAAVVAACVAGSLYGYKVPVYETKASVEDTQEQEDEVPVVKTSTEEETKEDEAAEEEEQAKGSFDLEDGVYQGSGTGYRGNITVAVTIKDKQITSIEILSASDDEPFFGRAKGLIDQIIKKQSTKVDTVSGATYSSKGIISAVKNALTGEKDSGTTGSSQDDLSRIPEREDLQRALAARHGRAVQEKFNQATVAICGLGGLGSNIAIALARAGVGRLILTDFDRVDITNLHRQQYKATQLGEFKTEALAANLREIAPYLTIETHTTAITEENFEEILAPADVICEAFDNAEAKAMLVNGVLEKLHTKYLIAASGMAGFGSANSIQTRRITDRFYLCGDGISDVADDIGLVSSRVMICGAHEAHMVLRILSGQFEP